MSTTSALSKPLNRLQAASQHLGKRSVQNPRIAYSQARPYQFIPTASKMATSTRQTKAPWRDLLASHMEQSSGYEFTIGTIGFDEDQQPVPRVRTCGCRGFFPELDIHPKSQEEMKQQVKDGGNPPAYESDLLCFTTDIRMEKLHQLESSGHAVEAIFWLKDLMTQWRVKGKAFAIGDPRGEEFKGEKASREAIGSLLRVKEGYGSSVEQWTWDRAVTKYFANHSPLARGSFKNPFPGMPRSQEPENPALGMGQRVAELHDPVARGNFRVVTIIPEEVERLDLSNQEDMRRWKWILGQSGGKEEQSAWTETELWP
ncbi:uncharacterized protein N7469_001051 [Penicillium citrinum]|uniref:Pyridoxamine 5'-phosphate oxidase Alr4036 family FMN-binding domain-containing protein n=1 Tax=Penicillium citrinum TaxID=5077 RepID=A0A9W9TVY9_PENCI|nr:uncharacterized protein N7469_001051 [Penicillium citrinum]KAJ5242724.1 hypothetical protein N7469_001051 [Penicillium citrinum]